MKCKEMKKEIKDLRRAVRRRDEMIMRLRGMEERRVDMNYLELIIRPRRIEYLSEYHLETNLRLIDPTSQKAVVVRRTALHVRDLISKMGPEHLATIAGEEIALALLKEMDH